MSNTLARCGRAITFLILFFCVVTFVAMPTRAELTIKAQNVEYNLPYPGLLADHPLYFLKNWRDKLVLFLTRDYIKKAEIVLNHADKKLHMAMLLTKKGKWQLAARILGEGEDEFEKIPELLTTSRSQGSSPTDDFVQTLRLSNEKHYQIIETLLKESPQGERRVFEEVLKRNRKIKDNLLRI